MCIIWLIAVGIIILAAMIGYYHDLRNQSETEIRHHFETRVIEKGEDLTAEVYGRRIDVYVVQYYRWGKIYREDIEFDGYSYTRYTSI